jgi:hypothetical protein
MRSACCNAQFNKWYVPAGLKRKLLVGMTHLRRRRMSGEILICTPSNQVESVAAKDRLVSGGFLRTCGSHIEQINWL